MRRFPALRPELLALVTLAFASPAFADAPATKSPAGTEPARGTVPQARTTGVTFGIDGGSLVLSDAASSKTFRLHPIAAAVYVLADGQRSLEAIRAAAEASSGFPLDEAGLFAVLDALADANLLVGRVTPPGSADFGSFVASDGTLGTALLEPTTTKGSPEPSLAAARKSEEVRKAQLRPERVRESDAKRNDPQLKRAAEETYKARASEAKTRREVLGASSEASHKQAGRGTPTMQDTVIAAAKLRSEQLAKSESKLRVSEEGEKRQRPDAAAREVESKRKNMMQEQDKKRAL